MRGNKTRCSFATSLISPAFPAAPSNTAPPPPPLFRAPAGPRDRVVPTVPQQDQPIPQHFQHVIPFISPNIPVLRRTGDHIVPPPAEHQRGIRIHRDHIVPIPPHHRV